MASSEIIDLTASSPPRSPYNSANNHIVIDATPQRKRKNSNKRKSAITPSGQPPPPKEKESRKKRKSGDRSGKHSQSSKSRPNSPEPGEVDGVSRHQRRSPAAVQITDEDLFFVDVNPEGNASSSSQTGTYVPATTASPVSLQQLPTSSAISELPAEPGRKLLLPPHVSVFGDATVEILAPTPLDSDEEDFIEFLDYDKGMARYFDEQEEEGIVPKTTICKHCNAEGEHTTYDCPVIICTTCGSRDDHPTRNCPMSKICYNCGMKGHVSHTCPNPRSTNFSANRCNRCHSVDHRREECPTLWRMYEYVSEERRKEILHSRQEKINLAIGQGGEGYIATDEWCYNCGMDGHLGDDCSSRRVSHAPRERSAFGQHNVMSGPFFDSSSVKGKAPQRSPREWEQDGYDPTAAQLARYGVNDVPDDVGRKGKKKESDRMARQQLQTEQDDTDDWFANSKNVKNRSDPRSRQRGYEEDRGKGPIGPSNPTLPKKPTFSFNSRRRDHSPPRGPRSQQKQGYSNGLHLSSQASPSRDLLSRITDPPDGKGRRNDRYRDRNSNAKTSASSSHHGDRNRHGRQSEGRGRSDHRSGSRYNGGYTR